MFFNGIKEIDSPELARWLEEKKGQFRIIDVREMGEIAHGTVPQAQAMPLGTVPAHVHGLDRDATYVMVCRSGARSAQACMFLMQHGIKDVYNLRGGMIGWVQSGHAPVKLEASAA